MIPFWSNDPYILFNKDYIFDIWPQAKMTQEERFNAVTRFIILITVLGYILTSSVRLLIVGLITIFVIYLFFNYNTSKCKKKEGFSKGGQIKVIASNQDGKTGDSNGTSNGSTSSGSNNGIELNKVLQTNFKPGNRKNPFSNVLLTQINDEPKRLAAPPAFNPDVDTNITNDVKKSVQFMNPDIENTNKQLFGSLWENFRLDNSNRVFYTTANTRVANDQGAYGKFLYGDMPSAKGSSIEDNIQREKNNYRYTFY